ncbi:MAG: serine/threonine protein kinase [Syntrophaceae bacterium]|nr:serine/threonine protein kinase [Syntrophaceae bacterium]
MNYGRYEIIEELGKGSMGVVYRAYDPQIDRPVALKVLREDRMTSEAFVQRFLKEAKAIGRLSHPNIVTVFDAGEDKGTIYIAMELLEGNSLNRMAEDNRLTLKETVHLGIQIADTLDYAHRKGIVHRDVKPSNIILQSNGQIKITDFGIAHIEDPSALVQTQAGEILGTPAYMSPEQVLSRPVDGRSDLFSLGIILYELCTGRRPFGGENMAAIFHAITQDHPPEPTQINPAISQELSQIILKCLRKMPDDRFEAGHALARALSQSLGEKEPLPQKESKRKIPFFTLVILLVLALGGLSYYFILPRVTKPPAVEKVALGSLKVESQPLGAQVFVDGAFKGKTPLTLGLSVGKHEVRLTLPEHHDWEAQVQLKEEGETPLLVRLIPIHEK